MATKTNNGPRANPGEIKQVLNFAKELFSNRLLAAFKAILYPCCTVEVTNAEYDCGTTDLTLTISPAQPAFGTYGFAQVFTEPDGFYGAGTLSADGSTVTVTGEAPPVGNTTVIVSLFLPTGQSTSTPGVYLIATGPIAIGPC